MVKIMEKIYMEENKNRKSVIDGSVVLSFVVAAFAIFSLVAVGFNQISYAAVPHSPTEDTFTFYATGEKITPSSLSKSFASFNLGYIIFSQSV